MIPSTVAESFITDRTEFRAVVESGRPRRRYLRSTSNTCHVGYAGLWNVGGGCEFEGGCWIDEVYFFIMGFGGGLDGFCKSGCFGSEDGSGLPGSSIIIILLY